MSANKEKSPPIPNQQTPQTEHAPTPLNPNRWTPDAGDVISLQAPVRATPQSHAQRTTAEQPQGRNERT